jgi:hypothetical protein
MLKIANDFQFPLSDLNPASQGELTLEKIPLVSWLSKIIQHKKNKMINCGKSINPISEISSINQKENDPLCEEFSRFIEKFTGSLSLIYQNLLHSVQIQKNESLKLIHLIEINQSGINFSSGFLTF